MMTQNADKKREQIQMFCMDDLVPQDHLLRLIDQAIDWSFIYDLVIDKYSADNGRPSMDPVMLIKIPFIQYLYGIRSMRQTVKEIEVNVAYRWFLGLEMMDKVPHFSTFGKNYTRRFKDTDLFEQIFSRILQECYKYRLIDPSEVFVDATHVKARANSKKMRKRIADEEALFFEEQLKKEINEDREAHGKKPLKEKKEDRSSFFSFRGFFPCASRSSLISFFNCSSKNSASSSAIRFRIFLLFARAFTWVASTKTSEGSISLYL